MEYDEIKITTRREIAICEGAIERLEIIVASMERKYGRDSNDFFRDPDCTPHPYGREIILWQESFSALLRWKERLAEHMEIMKL